MRACKSDLRLLGDFRRRQDEALAAEDAGHAVPGDENNSWREFGFCDRA